MNVLDQQVTDRYALYNGDCCEVLPGLKAESVHLSIYSPPFCGLYHYSSSDRDLSNARSYDEFMEHYAFVVREIHRVTLPGRISAVHCIDIPIAGANIAGHHDFPGDVIRLHQTIGFDYTPRICIWKEPLGVRNRTMAKALAHRQIVEDSTLTNVAAADYLIPFRKRGVNPVPVTHPRGLLDYAGERRPPNDVLAYRGWTGDQIENRYSHWIWRQYASCFWDDVRIDRVVPFTQSRDEEDEKHVHPLQLDVIDRCVTLWSNPDETILDPFGGVGSTGSAAITLGRRAVMVELKPSYYRQMLKNIRLSEVPRLESAAFEFHEHDEHLGAQQACDNDRKE